MKTLSLVYRFASNFLLLAMVYIALNFLDQYQQRAIVAVLVLIYCSMRAISALRSFYFFQRVERLEFEVQKLSAGANNNSQRKQMIEESASMRRGREINAYIDLLFLTLIILLCVSRIVVG